MQKRSMSVKVNLQRLGSRVDRFAVKIADFGIGKSMLCGEILGGVCGSVWSLFLKFKADLPWLSSISDLIGHIWNVIKNSIKLGPF